MAVDSPEPAVEELIVPVLAATVLELPAQSP